MWVKLIKYIVLKQETKNQDHISLLKIKTFPKKVKDFYELNEIMEDYDDFEILEK